MKILLLGEYSNVHWTLATGLRNLGHKVMVVSDGDGFKNYQRDIDISMKSENRMGQIKCLFSILRTLPKLKGFDVVQVINPNFTRIHHINLLLYKYLKKHNRKIFLGAFGNDYFYTKACIENKVYRYSEFFVDGKPTNLKANKELVKAWIGTFRQKANIEMANSCDGIIAGLYDYYMAYEQGFGNKLNYIPLPINLEEIPFSILNIPEKVRFFVSINKDRMEIKGTPLFLKALKRIEDKYSDRIEIFEAESLPYGEYKAKLQEADVVLDQTYSYCLGMTGLLTLAGGKILVSSAEPEMYKALGEKENKPVCGILPSVDDIYQKLESLILNKNDFPVFSQNGRLFVETHHDYTKVAKQYINVWSK
ncbi:glycosyltransferase family 4 protein [Dysgonomonas sp. 520]|uniref:glycosyltransferase family 4 protein n=1 Tax=Dysgonomonas sp. 520 TaxID=2302931 RepID=UPI0013D8B7AD|nr:glycosyltransferase family 4 protein [Dysgonomonas sp. 520]NDW08671.1 glycosyltransferase family 1 protein [Dysgonomonas sp. 520]